MSQGGRKGRGKSGKNKKELLAAGVTFSTPVTSLPTFLETGAHFMESTTEQAAPGFDFSNFPSSEASRLKFSDVSTTTNSFDSDVIIPTFVETLKPVLTSN